MAGVNSHPIRVAYDASVGAWAHGPAAVYDRLAEALVAASPISLIGAYVLDIGAGTGAASRAALAAGARIVAADLALGMLRHDRARRPAAAVADAVLLPFRNGAFDAALAAFSYNHVPDPERAFAEARRVIRPGGAVLASTFARGADHPAKALVEAAAARFGYARPSWYVQFKHVADQRLGDPTAFAATAVEAGLTQVVVRTAAIDVGIDTAAQLVAWRLGMAHTAPFVATLDPTTRRRLFAEAVAAVGPEPQPLCLAVLILSSRVPA